MAVVVFDAAAFLVRYPEFSAVSAAVLGEYFIEAGVHLENTDSAVVQDVALRSILLNMIVAHIASLSSGATADRGGVGRISSASEGSVSASFDIGEVRNSQAYWAQTQYGLAFWAATRNYRTMLYYSGRSVAQAAP